MSDTDQEDQYERSMSEEKETKGSSITQFVLIFVEIMFTVCMRVSLTTISGLRAKVSDLTQENISLRYDVIELQEFYECPPEIP